MCLVTRINKSHYIFLSTKNALHWLGGTLQNYFFQRGNVTQKRLRTTDLDNETIIINFTYLTKCWTISCKDQLNTRTWLFCVFLTFLFHCFRISSCGIQSKQEWVELSECSALIILLCESLSLTLSHRSLTGLSGHAGARRGLHRARLMDFLPLLQPHQGTDNVAELSWFVYTGPDWNSNGGGRRCRRRSEESGLKSEWRRHEKDNERM